MFNKLSQKEIWEKLDKREAEKQIATIQSLDGCYLFFLSKYKGMEITPDIDIFSYEKSITKNQYVESNYPNIASALWVIGGTGQGDEWFISKDDGNILFYDHNQGEYSGTQNFVCLDISFLEFLQMAFLYRDLENMLDEWDDGLDEEKINGFKKEINAIKSNLYELYPFQYF